MRPMSCMNLSFRRLIISVTYSHLGQSGARKPERSSTAGIFLSQFLYWTPRSQDREGWIYKTQDEIYGETGLTRWEQETARTKLREAGRSDDKKGKEAKLGGVLEEKLAGVPSRLYYRVNMAALISLLNSQKQSDVEEEAPEPDEPIPQTTSYDAEIPHPTMSEATNPSPGSGKATSKDEGKPHYMYQRVLLKILQEGCLFTALLVLTKWGIRANSSTSA